MKTDACYETTIPVDCPELIDVTFFSTDVVCAGDADGTISVDAVGGWPAVVDQPI